MLRITSATVSSSTSARESVGAAQIGGERAHVPGPALADLPPQPGRRRVDGGGVAQGDEDRREPLLDPDEVLGVENDLLSALPAGTSRAT